MTDTEAAIAYLNARFYRLCRERGITPPIGEQTIAEAA